MAGKYEDLSRMKNKFLASVDKNQSHPCYLLLGHNVCGVLGHAALHPAPVSHVPFRREAGTDQARIRRADLRQVLVDFRCLLPLLPF